MGAAGSKGASLTGTVKSVPGQHKRHSNMMRCSSKVAGHADGIWSHEDVRRVKLRTPWPENEVQRETVLRNSAAFSLHPQTTTASDGP